MERGCANCGERFVVLDIEDEYCAECQSLIDDEDLGDDGDVERDIHNDDPLNSF